jgi:hypothetical protein
MLTGRKFKVERETLALAVVEGRRTAITLPAGAIFRVVSWPTGDGDQMADVIWDGQAVQMFAVDVKVRGTEIEEHERGTCLSTSA